eukprot:TRINITY_DN7282_c0_g1_i2.p1 TRINITY_DN7282_c0_g1~~TRINITY_DN7282_c0_g1_i2.p1  ORF type:complete len:674 (-),score=78.95 TRINITY_DN7282_c0_g1_i2:61-1956(-)
MWPLNTTYSIPFQDPIAEYPIANLLIKVDLKIYGSFGCSPEQSGAAFMLNSEYIDWAPLNRPNPVCKCPQCTYSAYANSTSQVKGFLNYVYGGTNMLQAVATGQELCLSEIYVNLTFIPRTPCISTINPASGSTTGGTNITITGRNLFHTPELSCLFGNKLIKPLYSVSPDVVVCATPPYPHPSNTEQIFNSTVRVLVNKEIYTQSVPFYYYVPPELYSISPTSINLGESKDITVLGKNFHPPMIRENSSFINPTCFFGNEMAINSTYVNETLIICLSPMLTQNSGGIYIAVSLNHGADKVWSNNSYLFLIGPPPKYFLLYVVLFVFVVFLLGVIVLWLSWSKFNRPLDPALPTHTYNEDIRWSEIDLKQFDLSELQLQTRIGRGNFGEVFKADWKGTVVAVKRLPSNKFTQQSLLEFAREALMMKSLRHPNILQFLGACTDPPDICIVMEYMSRGSLYRIIHSKTLLPWHRIKSIAIDAAKGMAYLHNHAPVIIHRDLKSHNLLVDDFWRVKVCDFGLSRFSDTDSKTMTACGTPSWTAPEILRNSRYTEKADVYSFGIVLWEMASREEPFPGLAPYQVIFKVGQHKERPLIPVDCPQEYSYIIELCWNEDPELRPPFNELITQLQDFAV